MDDVTCFEGHLLGILQRWLQSKNWGPIKKKFLNAHKKQTKNLLFAMIEQFYFFSSIEFFGTWQRTNLI